MDFDESPFPAIADAYSLFHGAKPELFAELLVEHLTEHGWALVRASQTEAAAPSQKESA